MKPLEKTLVSTLLYYHLIDRPLTNLELFKFLNGPAQSLKFNQFLKTLKTILPLVQEFRGFYFLKKANYLFAFAARQKKAKISQLKWKKIKKIARTLQLVPFLRMVGATGSLTLDNANPQSDFDFLIVLQPGRLWLGRTAITLLLQLLGWRRHGQKTKDRVCLNCYLASPDLQINSFIKPHNLHSAQEYGRLIPLWQVQKNIFIQFRQANYWLKNFLINYPWPIEDNLKMVKSSPLLALIRKSLEWWLSGRLGDWLEKWLATWQTKRIKRKIETRTPADQIYVSDQCLMFHPQSKSLKILTSHQAKLNQLVKEGGIS